MPITQMQNEIITWTDPAGNVTSIPFLFAETGVQAVWGITGRGMPPIADNERATAYQPGAALIFSRHDVREIGLPIEIWAYDITTLRSYERELATALDPVRGYDPATGIFKQGTLSFTLETGITRQITCRLVKGFEWTEDLARGAGFVARAVLVFRASDPYFYDPRTAAAQTISVTGGGGGTGSGTTYTTTATMTNAGSVRTWPVWTLTINSSSVNSNDAELMGSVTVHTFFVVRNLTTGDYFEVYVSTPTDAGVFAGTITIVSTDTVRVVDTRPTVRTVKDGGGADALTTFVYQNLFPLPPGANSIRAELFVPGKNTQSTNVYSTFTASATVSMVYQPGFLTL